MKKSSMLVVGLLGVIATACGGLVEDGTPVSPESATLDPAGKGGVTAPMLNLSHIECTADGNVLAHFVLLFAGSGTPGALSGTYNGGAFGPVSASKNTGNVWHYNVILPSGEIEILSASTTTSSGASVTLHNPGEYSGDYQCGAPPPVCSVSVAAQDVYCTDKPLGNPGDECAAFGLLPQGKDDNLSGLTFTATQSALLAIVKSGTHGCGPGNAAYRIYANVTKGDALSTPVDQGISHVTYCACPD
jgi:hypothetical protein